MSKYVIDASVAVKWFCSNNEENLDEANILLKSFLDKKSSIIVPGLFFYELGNVFVKSKKLSVQEIKSIFDLLEMSGLQFSSIDEKLYKVAELAIKYQLTFYDASYLELAKKHSAFLVTEDEALLKTKLDFVLSLKDIKHYFYNS